ncbi:MAG: GNAT family N-acetyltransferase [Chloroflexi bacterium]|nr:GNAT family N-acetyltransferase [Chloroflexota bacterium]
MRVVIMVGIETYNLAAFPLELTLLDDTTVVIRPMTTEDEERLLAFIQALPEEERFFMKEDAASPLIVRQWVRELDYSRALPLLALVDGDVVAGATLVRSRGAARRHVGELCVQVHPDYRSLGLGTVLMHQLMVLANEAGLQVLTLEAVAGKEDEAIRTAQWLGFTQVAHLKGAAKDPEGRKYDVVVVEALLGKWYEWWPCRVSISQAQVRFPW